MTDGSTGGRTAGSPGRRSHPASSTTSLHGQLAASSARTQLVTWPAFGAANAGRKLRLRLCRGAGRRSMSRVNLSKVTSHRDRRLQTIGKHPIPTAPHIATLIHGGCWRTAGWATVCEANGSGLLKKGWGTMTAIATKVQIGTAACAIAVAAALTPAAVAQADPAAPAPLASWASAGCCVGTLVSPNCVRWVAWTAQRINICRTGSGRSWATSSRLLRLRFIRLSRAPRSLLSCFCSTRAGLRTRFQAASLAPLCSSGSAPYRFIHQRLPLAVRHVS